MSAIDAFYCGSKTISYLFGKYRELLILVSRRFGYIDFPILFRPWLHKVPKYAKQKGANNVPDPYQICALHRQLSFLPQAGFSFPCGVATRQYDAPGVICITTL